jgi:hypothetical protein
MGGHGAAGEHARLVPRLDEGVQLRHAVFLGLQADTALGLRLGRAFPCASRVHPHHDPPSALTHLRAGLHRRPLQHPVLDLAGVLGRQVHRQLVDRLYLVRIDLAALERAE